MAKSSFHDEPYDAGTLTKLKIFEAYVEAWIPVFTSKPEPPFPEIHIFDFFSGPGTDSNSVAGSPLRILSKLKNYQQEGRLQGWDKVSIHVHLSDSHQGKTAELASLVKQPAWHIPGINLQVQTLKFEDALLRHEAVLRNHRTAKLLIIDPFGVNNVTDDVFRRLIGFPTTDFIFFVPSAMLNRFRHDPSIKVKIDRPEDTYDVHRCAFDHFKEIAGRDYFLGRFSIKKPKGNIYGLIFGSRHHLGIHKFLEVAWGNDVIAGEANFDIDRENVSEGEMLLALDELRPKKIQVFEQELEIALQSGVLGNEADLIRFCIEAGMISKHCKGVLARLKARRTIACEFDSPSIRYFKNPRTLSLL